MADANGGWLEFWSRPHSIYANERNLRAHFDALRCDLAPLLPPGGVVLDFGCGDALAADALADQCRLLYLFDAVPAVQARLSQRFAGHSVIRILDQEAYAALPDGSCDLIMAVSVVQYVSREGLADLAGRWRKLLAPGGRLLVADVVRPGTPALRDVASQLKLARRHGFLPAALFGLVRLVFSDYRRLRKKAGFSTYEPAEMLRLLADAGLEGICLPRNIGPTAHRCSFLARHALPGGQEPPNVQ